MLLIFSLKQFSPLNKNKTKQKKPNQTKTKQNETLSSSPPAPQQESISGGELHFTLAFCLGYPFGGVQLCFSW